MAISLISFYGVIPNWIVLLINAAIKIPERDWLCMKIKVMQVIIRVLLQPIVVKVYLSYSCVSV